jgi:aryl-alcohol dehydrogenase-like predicted oxidoreductase
VEHRWIGSLSVSVSGLGCNNFARKIDQGRSTEVVKAALESGINFFDTADVYGYGNHPYSGNGGSEEFLAAALGERTSDVVIATKFGLQFGEDPGNRGAGRGWIRKACEGSLRRLGRDYIDLYMIHFPDPQTPIDETLGALNELVIAGKVREIGCSNFNGAQLVEAAREANANSNRSFICVENEYSLLRREVEEEVIPVCDRLGITLLPYFPLASGLLTGRYSRGEEAPEGSRLAFWTPRAHFELTDDLLDRVELLSKFAAGRDRSLLELALSWLASRPRVASVIAGATTPEQVLFNVAALGWQLSPDDLAAVDALTANETE